MRRVGDAHGLSTRRAGAHRPLSHLGGAVDRRLLRRSMRRRPEPIDKLLVRLSEAGDHSILWLVLAALGATLGGSRGRRAAEHGVLALAISSASVNGPLKLMFERRRPAPRRHLHRRPRTSSFPSGHSASAFAFAVAVTRELPEAGPFLLPLAATVAYSRVYLGVHYPSDVIAGAAFGTAVGMEARSAAQRLGISTRGVTPPSASRLPSTAVLVSSPHAGNSRHLARARRALDRCGIQVVEELDVEQVDRLPELLRASAGEPRLVIAGGGDGTVGSVAAHLAATDHVLGVLPLGTGNDFARALEIPLNPRRAAELLSTGEISNVDLGCLMRPGQPPAYFAHAATAGLNVNFSKLATRASVRARLGRLTYLVAGVYALRERAPFKCALQHEGVRDELELVQLSVISAPVVGGALGLSIRGPYRDDHGLDVVAVEDVPPLTVLRAGLYLLMGIKRPVAGVRAMHVDRLAVDSDPSLGVALDGELDGTLPGRLETLEGAVRVIIPRGRHASSSALPRQPRCGRPRGPSSDCNQQNRADPA